MSNDKERRDEALVPQTTRGLITRSSGLVRRGLDDLTNREKIEPREHLTLEETIEKLKRSAQELIFDAINGLGMEFVLIPAGRFKMGSNTKEDEKPIHEVTISKPFYMAPYLVTQSHWRSVMGADPEHIADDYGPVFGISWDDAHEFIKKLDALNLAVRVTDDRSRGNWRTVQFNYRLPTEAEWEYACRAGLTGDVTAASYFMDIYGDAPRGRSNQSQDSRPRPNAFCLHNMIVGYKEWCEDRYHINYDGAPSDASAWGEIAGANNRVPQMNRVARGSLKASPEIYKRASARTWAAPWSRGVIFGLRLVANER